ncbi:ribosome biogenesis GTPase Der [Oscillatoria laete-virens NRMC-F 0139]|nr:ribosome biogenesis GTPase Der [Oscillatoria laete-virens]MDL5053940.1 ribosome biogenesis GTPase Der [Oscillatoria laete-virens NRMC-F 0139]
MNRDGKQLVAIVGRPNVGKSALFNKLAHRQIAIVHDMPGTTRDRIIAEVLHRDKVFDLMDTGGIGVQTKDPLRQVVNTEVDVAIESADLILFVVDAKTGLHPVDKEVAGKLRRSKKNVFLIINKLDSGKQQFDAAEFTRLGFDTIFHASAAHGIGIKLLADAVSEQVGRKRDFAAEKANRPTKIVIIGKPNVGKSSLVNRLLDDERTIVSDIAGTTRDSVDLPFMLKRGNETRPYVLIDTAGIRHRSKVSTSVEVFSVMRSEKAIKRADLVVLILDAQSGVTNQDKKIAGFVQKLLKPLFIVVNKWDIALEQQKLRRGIKSFAQEYEDALKKGAFFLPLRRGDFSVGQNRAQYQRLHRCPPKCRAQFAH